MEKELKKLREDIINCNECIHAERDIKIFPFINSFQFIPINTRILFLAQDPPRNSQNYFYFNYNSQFTKRILNLLFKADILSNPTMQDFVQKGFYLTDSVKCLCGNIEKCRGFLLRELHIVKPKIICTLGSFALKSVVKEKRVTLKEFSGKIVQITSLIDDFIINIPVFSCYFPIRSKVSDKDRIEHFIKLKDILGKLL